MSAVGLASPSKVVTPDDDHQQANDARFDHEPLSVRFSPAVKRALFTAHARGVLRETARMAYDLELADRIRAIVQAEPGLAEKRMFGGLAFLIQGHMAVSASSQGGLLLRVDPAKSESLINEPHARRFEMRGRQMAGWLRVDPEAVAADDDLQRWVSHGITYARSLPAK
jgi:TfoX N-terminal domain